MKRALALLALAAGVALMAWLLAQADWQALRTTLKSVSAVGFASILCVYPLAIWLDALTWQPYFRELRSGIRWTMQLWRTQVVADAVLYITPLGAAGSEATKAFLLKHRHGVSYSDATASLISLQLLLALAQVPFLIIGMAVLLHKKVLSPDWQNGLVSATVIICLFMLLVMTALHKRWLNPVILSFNTPENSAKIAKLLAGLENVEAQIATILHEPRRFLTTLLWAFANWACFAFEIWLIARVLGKPISFADAWAIETLVSLARAATFFVPAHLGAQDGATSFAFKIFYGDPTFGIAVALVRRARELIWALIALPFGFADLRKRGGSIS
jgi:glycosyltransferase 2 family protein